MHRPQLWILIVLLTLGSPAIAAPPRPATDRIDAVVGYPLVVRLLVDDERDLRRGIEVTLDDARTIQCPVYWVGSYRPVDDGLSWSLPSPRFEPIDASTAIRMETSPPGSWYTLIAIPLDSVGQGIWIGGQRFELNWLPDPERTILEARARDIDAFFAPALTPSQIARHEIRGAIDSLAESPFTRWRARMIVEGINPSATSSPTDESPVGYLDELHSALDDAAGSQAILDAIAQQQRVRWQVILGRVWLIDPALAERLKLTLTRVVRFEDRELPLWPGSLLTIEDLAHDLLSPWVDDDLRAKRARAWLDSLPRGAAWVIDDLGDYHPETEKFSPTIGIVSLPPEHGDTLVRIDAPGAETELATVDDNSANAVSLFTPPALMTPGQTIVPTQPISVRLGHAELTRSGLGAPILARPPGVRIGPLHRDWTMESLMSPEPNAEAPMPLSRSTVGVLHRTAPPSESDARVGWTLLVECASLNPGDPDDKLSIWVGPYTRPIALWRIDATGEAVFVGGSGIGIDLPQVRVVTLADRWTAQIALPPEAVSDDLLLSIGFERTDMYGHHSAWPRRMFPGQAEPGRLVVDVSGWDGFRQPLRQ